MKMPLIFLGHGSPMIALEKNSWTENFQKMGQRIIEDYGQPKAILMVSAHWYTRGLFIQREEAPRQIYDMYGFPPALYDLTYPVKGSLDLSQRVEDLLGQDLEVNNDWGIDHGTWTVLVHMFPEAQIPVVQLSLDGRKSPEDLMDLGRRLRPLREEGYLIMASGNIVHNLSQVRFDYPGGDQRALDFDRDFVNWVKENQREAYLAYGGHPSASFAVPSPDHLHPIFYILGAKEEGDRLEVFNQEGTLYSLTMTSLYFYSPK